MQKSAEVKLFGKVQGVFFRDSAKKKADELKIKGYAQNKPDGTVLIEAQGEEEALDDFLEWCGQGPELARVDKIEEVISNESKDYFDFLIK